MRDRFDIYHDNNDLTRGNRDDRICIQITWKHPHYHRDDEVEICLADSTLVIVTVASCKHKVGNCANQRFWLYRCTTDAKTFAALAQAFGLTKVDEQ